MDPVNDPPVPLPARAASGNDSDKKTVHVSCCHTLTQSALNAPARPMTMMTQQCDRLRENCSVEGCVDRGRPGDPGFSRICECRANITFYVYVLVAAIGAAMGIYYMPPNCETENDQYHKVLGAAGHSMWMSFFGYCFFRSYSHTASAQLDPVAGCTVRNPSLRGGGK